MKDQLLEYHNLVHEISFLVENGNKEKAQELLLKLDFLLHDAVDSK